MPQQHYSTCWLKDNEGRRENTKGSVHWSRGDGGLDQGDGGGYSEKGQILDITHRLDRPDSLTEQM